ncbi:MAG: carbohydrate kinase [Gemmatimonadaceae bacterium]
MAAEVLCVGEVLWDSLPAGLFLGGAPFNVACHLRAAGISAAMVSRIGDDRLGEEIIRRAARYGVATDLVQVDPTLRTGFVRVLLDDLGSAAYEIVAPAAWDAISLNDDLLQRANAARAIVFGSLAQRDAITRATIERLWESKALMVFDANLRPPFDDRDVVRRSLERADVVKLSHVELEKLTEWFGLPSDIRAAATALADRFGCNTVCVTRSREGAVMWRDGVWSEHDGFEVEVRDTVGAGDAFLAVLLAGILSGSPDSVVLKHANLIGAYVATQDGAVPTDQSAAIAQAVQPTRR